MKKLLILNSNISSKEIIEYAKSQGIYTIAADRRDVHKFSAKQWADEAWKIDLLDLDALEEKCREAKVDGVICGVSEFTLDIALELSGRLKTPFYCTKESMVYSRDKDVFKKAWGALGVPLPEDYYLSPELTDEELEKVKYPVAMLVLILARFFHSRA